MDDNPTMQKLKGKLKTAEGKLQEMTGDELGGKVKQIEGKAEQEIAELRISHKKSNPDRYKEDELMAREKAAQDAQADLDEDEYVEDETR